MALPALFGVVVAYEKNKKMTVSIIAFVVILVFFWVFYSFRNMRYILPIFGPLFVYFAVFWCWVGKKVSEKKSWLVCLFIAMLIFAGGNKIERTPKYYYNPNQDLYGDIQIADYKTTFKIIRVKFPNLSDMAVFNDWHEAQYWYLPEKLPTAYFIVNIKEPFPRKTDGHMVYGTLKDFLNEKSKHKRYTYCRRLG